MKICFFGESFVNGTGDEACLGWPGRICASAIKNGTDITYYNLGIRGDTSTGILGRWHQEASARINPGDEGRLIFSFGRNDCAAGEDGRARLSQNDRLKNARSVLVEAPKAWKTLFVGPVPITDDEVANKRLADLSRQVGALARAHRVPYLDIFTPLNSSEDWKRECDSGDGIHPHGSGYQMIADLVEVWDEWQAWVG